MLMPRYVPLTVAASPLQNTSSPLTSVKANTTLNSETSEDTEAKCFDLYLDTSVCFHLVLNTLLCLKHKMC